MTTAAAEFLEMASPSANPGAALSVTSAMTSVGAALDQLARALGHAVTVGRDEVAGIERLVRRVESIRLAVIARVERDRVAVRSGSSNTASWVSQATRSGGGVAAGQVALATALESGLPATRAALAAGEVSTRHAAIIAGAMAGLPVELADAEREKVEASLVRDARRLEPSRLRQTASMALAAAGKGVAEAAAHQEQVLLDQERKAYAASRLTLFDHGDGTTTGRFLVPTGTAMVLRKVLQSMTAPRRDHQRAGTTDRPHASLLDGPSAGVSAASSQRANGNESPPTLDVGEASAGSVDDDDLPVAEALRARSADWDSLDWHEKHGRAFVDLLEHLPTDRLTGKVASTIVVTMTAEQVFGAAAIAEPALTLEVIAQPEPAVGSSGQRAPVREVDASSKVSPATDLVDSRKRALSRASDRTLGRLAATPDTFTPQAKPDAWPATPGSFRPSSGAARCPWTSGVSSASLRTTSDPPSRPSMRPAPPWAATGPTPGANFITSRRGEPAAARTSRMRFPYADSTTAASTIPPTFTDSTPPRRGSRPSGSPRARRRGTVSLPGASITVRFAARTGARRIAKGGPITDRMTSGAALRAFLAAWTPRAVRACWRGRTARDGPRLAGPAMRRSHLLWVSRCGCGCSRRCLVWPCQRVAGR